MLLQYIIFFSILLLIVAPLTILAIYIIKRPINLHVVVNVLWPETEEQDDEEDDDGDEEDLDDYLVPSVPTQLDDSIKLN